MRYLTHLCAAVFLVLFTLVPGFAQEPTGSANKETQTDAQNFLRRAEIAWRQGHFQDAGPIMALGWPWPAYNNIRKPQPLFRRPCGTSPSGPQPTKTWAWPI